MKAQVVAAAIAAATFGGFAADATFRDGDRVVFLGDSLTQGGRYHRIVSDYYLTRFPDRNVRFFDAGVGGDSAKHCWPRFVGDVVRPKPTVVCVMFGSNDAGFRTQAEFAADMTNIADRIAKECGNPRTIWITSTPYDEYSVREKPQARKGYDAKMRCYEEVVRRMADYTKGGYCEFGDPMRDYMAWKRKDDPSFSLMPDRDHPKEPGHLVMAWKFLTAQGAPSLVSAVTVDAAALTAKADNATVEAPRKASDGALEFLVTEKALPMPFHAETQFVLDDLPIVKDLSRETLTVSGLGWGWWALVIDGQQVVEAGAEDWAKGVDLATLDTPQMRQAKRVMDLNGERFKTYNRYRRFVAMRWWTQWSPKIVKHPDDEENYDDLRALWQECVRTGDTNNYYNCVMPDYWSYWPKRADELKKVDALYDAARTAAQPIRRNWRLERR